MEAVAQINEVRCIWWDGTHQLTLYAGWLLTRLCLCSLKTLMQPWPCFRYGIDVAQRLRGSLWCGVRQLTWHAGRLFMRLCLGTLMTLVAFPLA